MNEISNKILTVFQNVLSKELYGNDELKEKILQKLIETFDLQLEKEEKKNNNRKKCVICLSRSVDCIYIPCGHYCVCSICNLTLEIKSDNKCPICRSKSKAFRVFETSNNNESLNPNTSESPTRPLNRTSSESPTRPLNRTSSELRRETIYNSTLRRGRRSIIESIQPDSE
jgi:hypothetical protein